MAQRLQLTQDVYMPLDGQWGIVLSGTVFDAPSTMTFHPTHAQTYAGVPNAVTKPTSVTNVRRK